MKYKSAHITTQAQLEELIGRYFEGDTSVQEEKALRQCLAHCPWQSDTITEQNALISSLKSDCETLRQSLTSKQQALHEAQMALTATQGKFEVETENLNLLLARQRKDTEEWQTFAKLDRSFIECSRSTNREARTAMMRQLIEKTTIDAENAEKDLNTFTRKRSWSTNSTRSTLLVRPMRVTCSDWSSG